MVGVKNRIEETSPRVVTFNVTLSYFGKVSSLLYAEYGSNSPYLTGKLICVPHNLQNKCIYFTIAKKRIEMRTVVRIHIKSE